MVKTVDYMEVAERLYKHINPNSNMDTPSSVYVTTEKWWREWIQTGSKLSLYEWCIENKTK